MQIEKTFKKYLIYGMKILMVQLVLKIYII